MGFIRNPFTLGLDPFLLDNDFSGRAAGVEN